MLTLPRLCEVFPDTNACGTCCCKSSPMGKMVFHLPEDIHNATEIREIACAVLILAVNALYPSICGNSYP